MKTPEGAAASPTRGATTPATDNVVPLHPRAAPAPASPQPVVPDRPPDWRTMMDHALPLLEWVADNPDVVGDAQMVDEARRLVVRHYVAAVDHPRLRKAVPRDGG